MERAWLNVACIQVGKVVPSETLALSYGSCAIGRRFRLGCIPARYQQDDMLIDRHAPLLAHLFIGFMPLKGQRLIDWLSALRGLIYYLFDSVIVSTHDAHDHFSCILGKVETIRDLDCIRSCFSRRFCIRTTPVSTDHFDSRMALEPGGNRGFFAIREQIDQAMTFQIQQDGAVLHSFPKRKIVHTKDFGRRSFWHVSGSNQPEKGICT